VLDQQKPALAPKQRSSSHNRQIAAFLALFLAKRDRVSAALGWGHCGTWIVVQCLPPSVVCSMLSLSPELDPSQPTLVVVNDTFWLSFTLAVMRVQVRPALSVAGTVRPATSRHTLGVTMSTA